MLWWWPVARRSEIKRSLEDGTAKPWFEGGAATRYLRAELALSGATTRRCWRFELLIKLATVATLPEDRCLTVSTYLRSYGGQPL